MPASAPSPQDYVPPALDTVAAAHWHRRAPALSPWLHEEVGRRMQERLQWLRQGPASWCHWEPVRGGLQTHALLAQRYPDAPCTVYEAPARLAQARTALERRWWQAAHWRHARMEFAAPAEHSVHMLWANMLLHSAADARALLLQWRDALAVDGLLMFSCLGPDSLRTLRTLYQSLGWPPAGQEFTDMHDWGDLLLQCGFADPVMDMERITLTFATPARALQELRELGRNAHPARFGALRGRHWYAQLQAAMGAQLGQGTPDGSVALSFEIIYGQAFKPEPRARVQASTAVSLDDMRRMLRTRPASGS